MNVTVLTVIEKASLRDRLSQHLRSLGAEISELRSLDNLELTVKHLAPDVLIVHIAPGFSLGKECCRLVKATNTNRHLTILAVVDPTAPESQVGELEAWGVDDFVSETTDNREIEWRLKSLARLGHDRRLFALRAPFEELATHNPEGIIISDASGQITYTNPVARAFFDSNVSFTGKIFDLFEVDGRSLLQAATQSPSPRIPVPIRIRLQNPCSPFYEASVTYGHLSENRLLLSLRLISTASELDHNSIVSQRLDILGQLTGGITHDLNNVLNAVIGGTTLLELDAAESLQPQIQTILKTAKRGGELLQQLLLFSRGSDISPEPTDLIEVARECAAISADTFPNNIEVRFRGPNTDGFPIIEANIAQIHQILMNLCVNARDGMPQGGQLTIAAGKCYLDSEQVHELEGAEVEGDYLTIEVRDSGVGIPPEVRSRIFEPFFTTKPKGKGTGLGLPTVMRLMQLHGGFVSVDSTAETGTSVKCYFPYTPAT